MTENLDAQGCVTYYFHFPSFFFFNDPQSIPVHSAVIYNCLKALLQQINCVIKVFKSFRLSSCFSCQCTPRHSAHWLFCSCLWYSKSDINESILFLHEVICCLSKLLMESDHAEVEGAILHQIPPFVHPFTQCHCFTLPAFPPSIQQLFSSV